MTTPITVETVKQLGTAELQTRMLLIGDASEDAAFESEVIRQELIDRGRLPLIESDPKPIGFLIAMALSRAF